MTHTNLTLENLDGYKLALLDLQKYIDTMSDTGRAYILPSKISALIRAYDMAIRRKIDEMCIEEDANA